jgi:hypothetical protein
MTSFVVRFIRFSLSVAADPIEKAFIPADPAVSTKPAPYSRKPPKLREGALSLVRSWTNGLGHLQLASSPMNVRQLAQAAPEWRAVFDDESLSRVVAWAVVGDADETRLVGIIVDPNDGSQLVPAPGTKTPDGARFVRYGFRGDDD